LKKNIFFSNRLDQSPRGSIDARKPLNLNIEPSIREGIAESHTRSGSQPWSPPYNPQSVYSPPSTNYFTYPSDNLPPKWNQSQMPMSQDATDNLRQRIMQPPPPPQQYTPFNQRSSPSSYLSSSSQRSPQQQQHQNFTDL